MSYEENQKRKYIVTEEQIKDIEHYKRMFELNAERIQKLCVQERSDIEYGFELGQIHTHLRECFIEMMNLEEEVRKQEVKTTKKK